MGKVIALENRLDSYWMDEYGTFIANVGTQQSPIYFAVSKGNDSYGTYLESYDPNWEKVNPDFVLNSCYSDLFNIPRAGDLNLLISESEELELIDFDFIG